MINQCYLPQQSSIEELKPEIGNAISKVQFFNNRVKDHIDILLGQTYVLPDVLRAFRHFSSALASLINPDIPFAKGQKTEKDLDNKYDVYDRYFEVTRISNMTMKQFIQQYLDTSAELVNEMQYTSMSRGEIAYILKGWEAANLILLSDKDHFEPDFPDEKIVEVAPKDNDERALYRWKLAHHGFGIFKIFSGYCFQKAVNAIVGKEDEKVIADWIDKGAHLFRATTSCMEFGNSFSAQVYRETIRTDMSKANKEANLPNGFSGTQNYEYIQWRKKKVELFSILKEHKDELSPLVIEKVELFRTYYLEDMHIHSVIAGRMVGIEKSLLQEGFANKTGKTMAITAGDMLRMMAARREDETKFILEML